jgi:hypothetical protein
MMVFVRLHLHVMTIDPTILLIIGDTHADAHSFGRNLPSELFDETRIAIA